MNRPLAWLITLGWCQLNLLAHYLCYWYTINGTKSLIGECATSSDHIVIYGISLDYDHEFKMQSRP